MGVQVAVDAKPGLVHDEEPPEPRTEERHIVGVAVGEVNLGVALAPSPA